MIVWYLTTLTYPSTLANRLQVMKMTEAFSRHAVVTLWVASMGDKKKEVLESYGVKGDIAIKELPVASGILWPRSFFRALAFRRIVREAPPQTVFYTRDVLLAFFLSFLSPRFRNNFFFECHSLGKFPDFIYQKVFRAARGVISTNQGKVRVIREKYGINEDRIFAAGNAFDEHFSPSLPRQDARKEVDWPQDRRIVLYVGSTQAWKGADMLEELSYKMKDVLFIVLGASQEKKTGNYWALLPVQYHEVPKYLRAADVLLAPYRQDSERANFFFSPIKIMEYRASGTPIIATKLGSIEEIFGDEVVREEISAEFPSIKLVRATAGDFQAALEKLFTQYKDVQERRERQALENREKYLRSSWNGRAVLVKQFIERFK